MTKTRRSFSRQFKAEAVELLLMTGQSIVAVAAELGINAGTLGNWVNRWEKENPDPVMTPNPGVSFSCYDDNNASIPTVGIYNESMQLIAAPNLADSLSAPASATYIKQMRARGSAIELLMGATNTPVCAECTPGEDAQVRILCEGDEVFTVNAGPAPKPGANVTDVTSVVGAQALTAEDLRNATVYFTSYQHEDYGGPGVWTYTTTFTNYESLSADGMSGTSLASFEPEQMLVNGVPYAITAHYRHGSEGSLIAGICAISPNYEAVCPSNPSHLQMPWIPGTDFQVVGDFKVDGDTITYQIYTDMPEPHSWVTQRFDGREFTIVDYGQP